MWKKLVSSDGNWWILEHREWTSKGPVVTKTFVNVNDSDFDQCQKFCEEKGL